jgi:hypothetical protein
MRTALAGAVSLIWLCLLQTGGGHVGRPLFIGIGVVALGFGLLAGGFLTADCLSEERREGTLGLLFLTELSGSDVVSAKLVAASLPVFYGLVSVLPLLALPLLIGGVTAGECWRSALVLVATLVWSLCLGLAVSAFSRQARPAVSATLLIVLVLGGALPAIGWLQVSPAKTNPSGLLLLLSPVALYLSAFDSAYQAPGGAREFWLALACAGGIAAAAFAVACAVLPHVWREGKRFSGGRATRGWRWRWRFGGERTRTARRKLLDQSPYLWLASRDRRRAWPATAASLCLFCIWLGVLNGCWSPNPGRSNLCFGGALLLAWVLHWVVKWFVAVEASQRLNEDRRSGLLDLVSVTPLSVEEILQGQRQALRRAFLAPVALALLTNAGLLWMLFSDRPAAHLSLEAANVYGGAAFVGAMMMLIDFRTLTWVGMSAGLRKKHHHQAVWAALQPVLVIPAVVLVGMWLLGATGFFSNGPGVPAFVWIAISLAADLVSTGEATEYLEKNLRGTNTGLQGQMLTEPPLDPCRTVQITFPGAAETCLSEPQPEVQQAVAFIDSVLLSAGLERDPRDEPSEDQGVVAGYTLRAPGAWGTSAWAGVIVTGTSVHVSFAEPVRSTCLHASRKPFGLLHRQLVQRYGSETIQVVDADQAALGKGSSLNIVHVS